MSIESIKNLLLRQSHSCPCGCSETGCSRKNCKAPTDKGISHSVDIFVLARLLVSAGLFVIALAIKMQEAYSIALIVLSALVAGYDVVISAFTNIFEKHFLDECFLMTVAVIAAFILGEYHEAAAVMFLYQLGSLLENYAVGRTKRSVVDLMDLRPDSVTLITDGEEKTVRAEDAAVGDTILIRPGEKVPVDCVVIEGGSLLDMSALTGESMPKSVKGGDFIYSGALNTGSPLKCEVKAIFSESTAARILDMVSAQSEKKGKTEKFITKFARIYTPIVLGLALLIFIILPLTFDLSFTESLNRALVFLVISCPCALVISVPLAYFAGIGGAARLGILFKSSMAVDAVSKAQTIVFDKTGTLTTGSFRVSAVKSDKMDANMMLKIAAHAESYSNHPIAKSIVAAYGEPINKDIIESFIEFPGKGIAVIMEDIVIILGNRELLTEKGVDPGVDRIDEPALYMAVDGIYAGRIVISDTIKEDAAHAVYCLSESSGFGVVMLTGDNKEISDKIARTIGIKEYYAECMPEDKVARVLELKERLKGKGTLIFVGDGINDAPVITAADAGMAMGGLGSDAAVEAADVIIMDDSPSKVLTSIDAAKSMLRIVYQNIAFAITVKLIIMVLGAVGIAPLWFAVFADVGVTLAAVLNSLRAFNIRKPRERIK